jgi:hypothetical protein
VKIVTWRPVFVNTRNNLNPGYALASILQDINPNYYLYQQVRPLLVIRRIKNQLPNRHGMHLAQSTEIEKRSLIMSMTIFEIARVLSAMASGLFLIGLVTFATGVAVLVIRSIGHDTRAISKSVVQLTEKGITDEITGLVGSASSLLTATRELIQTTKGIGVFLIISGAAFMLMGIMLTLYIGLS